jgi:ACS family D-galactonate transporter-like MFS transporter
MFNPRQGIETGGIFAARVLLGVAEAPAFPASQKATGYWFPRNDRSRSTAIFDSAARFSNVIGVPLVAFAILARTNERASWYA